MTRQELTTATKKSSLGLHLAAYLHVLPSQLLAAGPPTQNLPLGARELRIVPRQLHVGKWITGGVCLWQLNRYPTWKACSPVQELFPISILRGLANMLSVPKRFRHFSDQKMSLCFKIPIKSNDSKWKNLQRASSKKLPKGVFKKGGEISFPQQPAQQRIVIVHVTRSRGNLLIYWITFTTLLYQVPMLMDKIRQFQSENCVYCWSCCRI